MGKGWVSVAKVGQKFDEPAQWNLYCGRKAVSTPAGMIFAGLGNPYPKNCERSRTMAIAEFKAEFEANRTERAKVWNDAAEWIFRTVRDGGTVRLFCHCAPKRCHCEVIQSAAAIKACFPETPETPYSWQV